MFDQYCRRKSISLRFSDGVHKSRWHRRLRSVGNRYGLCERSLLMVNFEKAPFTSNGTAALKFISYRSTRPPPRPDHFFRCSTSHGSRCNHHGRSVIASHCVRRVGILLDRISIIFQMQFIQYTTTKIPFMAV